MRIVVLDGYTLNPGDNPWDGLEALGELTVHDRSSAEAIVPRAAGAEIVLTNKTPLTAATLEQLPELRFIGVLATGYNIVDVEAARQRGIDVANVPVYGTDSVAQFVFAQLLELCHHTARHDGAIRAGEWAASGDFCFTKSPLIELRDLTLGIVGFGRIGRRVAELATAFGMNILAASRSPGAEPAGPGMSRVDIPELFARADVVSLHCPETESTRGMVGPELLRSMKPSAFLINTARGSLIDEAALADALNQGIIAGAALDVVSAEPIRADNPLLGAANCLLTPHVAWCTLSARRRLMATTVANVRAFRDGEPLNIVN